MANRKLTLISSIGLLINLMIFCVSIFDNIKCKYMYFSVSNLKVFIISLVSSVAVPIILLICSLFIGKLKKIFSVLSYVIYILLIMVCIVFSFVFSGVMRVGISSYTDKIENYGVYDEFVIKTLKDIESFLPDTEIINEESKYYYNYDYGIFSENFWIEVDAEFDNEKSYFDECKRMLDSEMICIDEDKYYLLSNDEKICAVFLKNEGKKTIKYVLTYGYGEWAVERIGDG